MNRIFKVAKRGVGSVISTITTAAVDMVCSTYSLDRYSVCLFDLLCPNLLDVFVMIVATSIFTAVVIYIFTKPRN